ncbi:acetolactate synthase small subunit [bacterium]|nr:acetolactate synthase small subunit [bacterium]
MATTFSALVENKFWVLARISRLFSRHMFNIQSLTVASTLDPNISCMTIDVEEDPERLSRLELELKKVVNVLSVAICDRDEYVETEMVLVKIRRSNPNFSSFLKEMERFQARVVFRRGDLEIFEFSGDRESVEDFLKTSLAHEVLDVVRSGVLAMQKMAGEKVAQ